MYVRQDGVVPYRIVLGYSYDEGKKAEFFFFNDKKERRKEKGKRKEASICRFVFIEVRYIYPCVSFYLFFFFYYYGW